MSKLFTLSTVATGTPLEMEIGVVVTCAGPTTVLAVNSDISSLFKIELLTRYDDNNQTRLWLGALDSSTHLYARSIGQ